MEDLSPLKDQKHSDDIRIRAYSHHVYFFANPRSGDRTALKFINPNFHQFKVVFSKDECKSLREKNELSRGFESKKLTSESQQFEEVTVLVRIFDVTNKD